LCRLTDHRKQQIEKRQHALRIAIVELIGCAEYAPLLIALKAFQEALGNM
jgi:hypothetical protein